MPSGEVHAGMTLATAGLTYTWATLSGEPPQLAVATAVGCALGTIIGPDLDVRGTRGDRVFRESTGFIPAVIWGLLWNPYSALIPHRSVWSHGLIIGTLIRLAYMAVPLLLIGIHIQPGPILTRMMLGLLLSDNVHIGADFFVTGVKELYE